MLTEQTSSKAAALDGWGVGHIVLVKGTVGSVAEDYKVGAQLDGLSSCTSLVGDVIGARAGFRGWASTFGLRPGATWRRSCGPSTTTDSHLGHLFRRWLRDTCKRKHMQDGKTNSRQSLKSAVELRLQGWGCRKW